MKPSLMIPMLVAGGFLPAGLLTAQSGAEQPAKLEKLMDFGNGAQAPKWFSVNDGVMGGVSTGKPTIKNGTLHFMGDLSLDNNGGFSSIRAKGAYDFRGKEALVMRVKGDGRSYRLILATDARHRNSAVTYGAGFETEAGKWTDVKIPFKSLSPTWRGEKLGGPPFDASKVEQIGILIGDRKAGRFSLEVDWIGME